MARHKRYDTIHNVDRFVDEATNIHRTLQKYAIDLRPSGAQYQVISELSDAVRVAIEKISGKPAPWMNTYVSSIPANAPD